MPNLLFTPFKINQLEIKNRFIRAATYEGMADSNGVAGDMLEELYAELAINDVGLIISGFSHFNQEGRAMQPFQCGINGELKQKAWKKIADRVHREGSKLAIQLAHTGRQSIKSATGGKLFAPSSIRCSYFRGKPTPLTDDKISEIIEQFSNAALAAKNSNIDAVQIHAAHGYLIHQFLSPHTNRRKDKWGGSLENRMRFLEKILVKIRMKCGADYPIIIKLSASDDRGLDINEMICAAKILENKKLIDALEISYGTMEFALNIIRGAAPIKIALEHNPLFNKFPQWVKSIAMYFYLPYYLKHIKKFEHNYNLQNALLFVKEMTIPIFLTGGIRNSEEMLDILGKGIAALSLCRPFICEPNFIKRLAVGENISSKCTNCNLCTLYCDSNSPLKCYLKR